MAIPAAIRRSIAEPSRAIAMTAASPRIHSISPNRRRHTSAASRIACPRTSSGAAEKPRIEACRMVTARRGPGIIAPERPMMKEETKIAAG